MSAAVAQAVAHKSALAVAHRDLGADGAERWHYTRAVPLVDGSGAITEWLGATGEVANR